MTLNDELVFLDEEIKNAKLRLSSHGFHNGTALSIITRRYRDELKAYREVVVANRGDMDKWPDNRR